MKASEHFTCPLCGSHYFGRDIASGPDGKPLVLDTVRCHGSSSEKPYRACSWRGVWPPVNLLATKGREQP